MTEPRAVTPEEVAQSVVEKCEHVEKKYVLVGEWFKPEVRHLGACRDCIAAALLAQAQRDAEALHEARQLAVNTEMRLGTMAHARAAAEQETARLREALRRLMEALDWTEGNRGQYSCADPHDSRCPKGRVDSPDKWWKCECGAEELIDAQTQARAALAPPASPL